MVLDGEQGCGGSAGYVDLGVDVLHVMFGGPPGDDQPRRDLGVAASPRKQTEYLHLAIGKPSRQTSRVNRLRVAGSGEYRVCRVRVQGAATRLVEKAPARLVRLERRPMGSGLGEGPVGVGCGQDPCRHGLVLSEATAVVAAAVESFVVPADKRREPGELG
jgi:hypothetical protein